jgi:hypothetical protein
MKQENVEKYIGILRETRSLLVDLDVSTDEKDKGRIGLIRRLRSELTHLTSELMAMVKEGQCDGYF